MEKLEVEIEVVKCKIHEENLLEDFENKLVDKLNDEYINRNNSKKSANKVTRIPFRNTFLYRAAAVFVCFMVVSGCTFADEIQDALKLMFCNFDKNIEIAYDEGNVIEVDSEYQTYNGVSVKVDYVSLTDNNLCVVFNVKHEDECDRLYLSDLKIKDENDDFICDTNGENKNIKYNFDLKKENKNITTLLINLSKSKGVLDKYNFLNIEFGSLEIEKDDEIIHYEGNWNFKINFNKKEG